MRCLRLRPCDNLSGPRTSPQQRPRQPRPAAPPALLRAPRLPHGSTLPSRSPGPASPGVRAAERVGPCCSNGSSSSVGSADAVAAAAPPPEQQPPAPWWEAAAAPFRSSPWDGTIFALTLPAVLALAADPLLSIVDTIFVGHAGAEALAALGVNSALFTMSFVVFNFLATATTPLVAAALAKGDTEQAGKVTLQALLLATVLGSVLAVGLVFGADGALALMGAGPETGNMHQLAKDFLLIRAAASPAVLVATVGQGVFRGLQDMRTPLGITLAANTINLALDTVLILGLGWGVTGAACATSAAEWAAGAAYLALLWQRRGALGGLDVCSVLGAGTRQTVAEFGPFLRAGGAVLMRTAVLLGTKTLATATAARLGAVPIASHQVVSQLWLLSSLVIDSVAIAGQTLVAVELGKGNVAGGRAVSDRLLQLGVALGAVLAAGFWVAEPWIPAVFSSDAGIEASVLAILPLAVGMIPINAGVYVLDGVLVGAGDFKFLAGAMVVAAATAVGLLLGVEPLGLGLEGVWGALALLMVSRLATLAWRYQSPSGPLPPPQRGQHQVQQQQQPAAAAALPPAEPLALGEPGGGRGADATQRSDCSGAGGMAAAGAQGGSSADGAGSAEHGGPASSLRHRGPASGADPPSLQPASQLQRLQLSNNAVPAQRRSVAGSVSESD